MNEAKRTAAEQQALLCHILKHYEYDTETGAIRNKKSGVLRKGRKCLSNRYLIINFWVGGKLYALTYHRGIWALCNGRWPKLVIDHIDGNRDNNRIENLRECTLSENAKNVLHRWNPNPKTHVPGVTIHQGRFLKTINQKFCYFASPYSAFFIGTLCGIIYRPD